MNENTVNRSELLVKWLRVLMYIAIVSLVNSIVNFLPFVPASAATWISRGIMVAMVICLSQMVPLNPRYKKAAIFRTVMLACTLVTAFLFPSNIITLVASVFSIMSVYQEYSAHSELIAELDPKLSKKWHTLFIWGIVLGILVAFGSFFAVLIIAMLEMNEVTTVAIIVGLISVPQLVIDVVYLQYLKKMIDIFGEDGVL